MGVQTVLRKCRSWETVMTVPGKSSKKSSSQSMEAISRLFVGSSNMMISG